MVVRVASCSRTTHPNRITDQLEITNTCDFLEECGSELTEFKVGKCNIRVGSRMNSSYVSDCHDASAATE